MNTIALTTKGLKFADSAEEYVFKTFFFRQCTYEEIEEELLKYNIEIHHEQIVEEYRKCYSFDDISDELLYRYQDECQALDKEGMLLDNSALFFYLRKLIEENFDLSTLPDPIYISEQIDLLESKEEEQKVESFTRILKTIAEAAVYHPDQQTLNELIDPIMEMDVSFVLSDLMQVELRDLSPGVKQCEEILNSIEKIAQLYQDKDNYLLVGDALGLLASVSAKKAMTRLESAIKTYPTHQLSLCLDVLMELMDEPRYHKEISTLEDMMRNMPSNSEEDEICVRLLNDIMDENNADLEGMIN